MQLNPARGRKRSPCRSDLRSPRPRFMQLNPARGRKHTKDTREVGALAGGLCSSTPRGDGNFPKQSTISSYVQGLCSSTPRGDGNKTPRRWANSFRSRFMQLNPARGRKPAKYDRTRSPNCSEVYAAQPREGTETRCCEPIALASPTPGLCSSTPRGDGNTTLLVMSGWLLSHKFMQLNPARGRKRPGRLRGVDVETCVYAAQPREGTETPARG